MSQGTSSKEAELFKLLQEERDTCTKIKELYQTLKDEHFKLKDELSLVHHQLKEAISKHEKVLSGKDEKIQLLEDQLYQKQKEILLLSEEDKAFDAQKIRDSVLEEAVGHYEAKMKDLHAEGDRAREMYNNLHYELAILRCKFESREKEFSHEVERLKLQHLEEVHLLQNKIETLDHQKLGIADSCVDLNSAKHEVMTLNTKMKTLLAECEELRARNENLTLQLNNSNRSHSKQTSDNHVNIRTLESEKQKAFMKKEILEKEINNIYEQRRILTNELQASKKEILSLRNQLEETEHRSLTMATDLQVENEHLKAEFELERQYLVSELTNLKTVLKETASELENDRQVSASRELMFNQNVISLRQQLWKKSNELDEEKERMERKFHEFKTQRDNVISQLGKEVEILRENLKQCIEAKLELEKQFLSLREQLEAHGKDFVFPSGAEADILLKQNMHFANEIKGLKEQVDILKSSSSFFPSEKDKILQDSLSKQKSNHMCEEAREILDLKLKWEQQKHQFYQRIDALESQLKEAKNVFASERKELEQKIQHYTKITTKLKEKLEVHKVKNEDLEHQKEVLENNVPFEVHEQVLNKLTELQRRMEEYRFIVAAEPHFPACSQASASVPGKLLTDIQNLHLRFSPQKPPGVAVGKKLGARTYCKRSIFSRRRSVKIRSQDSASRVSPVISSSSDLENL